MIVKHVLAGLFFTIVGVITLVEPVIPFICIGALVFGPIELVFGLMGSERIPVSPRGMAFGIHGEGPSLEITTQRSDDLQSVRARVVMRAPVGHTVEVVHERTNASVVLDGRPYFTVQRGYLNEETREVPVPLDGAGKVLIVRFWGGLTPQIDLLMDGAIIGKA